jgi:Ca2+-binding EF-hand superfamily protein
LDKAELKQFFQLGMTDEDEELVDVMIDEVDFNKDGIISLKEFQQIMNTLCKNLTEQ